MNRNRSNPLADDLDHVLAHTAGLWEELRGRRIFITGGTGFFGCWLLESFAWACDKLNLDARAVVLTRRPDAFGAKAPHLAGHPAVELYEGDVRDFQFPEGRFSHVIHAATASAAGASIAPLEMIDTIVAGTRRTLDFAVHCGAGKFLLTSSGAVYGPQPPDMTHIPEDYRGAPDTMDPRSAYGEGKRTAELLCAIYAREHGLEAKIARGFAFVGPYLPLDAHFAIGNFIGDAIAGRTIEVRGDGTPYRSYLYGADLAIWLWTILCRGESCRPYNVGSEAGLTIAELAAEVAAVLEGPGINVQKPAVAGQTPSRYVPRSHRAESELFLRPSADLATAIRRTARGSEAQRT